MLDVIQTVSERQVPITVMVPIGLAVCCYVDKLRFFLVGESCDQAPSKILTAVEKTPKSHPVGDGSVIEEYVDAPSGWETTTIWAF